MILLRRARRWLHAGANWLHVVNLDSAFGENDAANRSALEAILVVAKSFGAQVQFGGGMRSLDSIGQAFALGVSRAVLGTIAIEQPEIVANALNSFWRRTNCCWNRCTGGDGARAGMEG